MEDPFNKLIDWLQRENEPLAIAFFATVLLTVAGKGLLEFIHNWRRWREKLHILEHCKTRLEIEKLRYEILALQHKLEADEAAIGSSGLPIVTKRLPQTSVEDILETYEPDVSHEDFFTLGQLKEFMSDFGKIRNRWSPFTPPPFRPWKWLENLHQVSRWLSLPFIALFGLISALLALIGLPVLLVVLSPPTPDATYSYAHAGLVSLAFPVGTLLLSLFFGWKAWAHLRRFQKDDLAKETAASQPPPLPKA